MTEKINRNDKYDAVIIGAGLGGLTCANRLAVAGYKVLLLESHTKLGGLATWFNRRGGHIFDISLHGFPVGMIKTCKKYWSKEIADSIVQLKGIRFDNPQFSFTTTFDIIDFKRILRDKFNIEQGTIDDFFKTVRSMNFFDDQTMTTRQLFDRFFPGRDDVVRMLMEPIAYANGSTLDDPAITYGIVFSNFMDKGVFTFRGGTDQLIDKMEAILKKNGVDIRVKSPVEKVIVKDGIVRGVVTGGRSIYSDAVISNANIISTIKDFIGYEKFPDGFIEKVHQTRLNNSSCQVYIGLKKGETINYIGDLLFTSTAEKFDSEMLRDKNVTSRTFSIYYPDIRPGTDMYSIVASTNANYDDWADLPEERYKKDKEHLISTTIDALQKYIPDIRKKIDYVEAATPKTFKRYTRHLKGSSFGTKFEGLKVSMELPENIGGLFHTGSVGIIMSGWLGAVNYGVIIANNVDKYLRKC